MSEDTPYTIKDMYARLRKDLPPEAYSTDNSRGFALTGIKGAYVVERLNDVFGLCGHGWCYTVGELLSVEGFALAHLELQWSFNGNWSKPVFAAGDQRIVKGRIGDAEKGAITDALKKAASMIGVGHLCYKGQVETSSTGNSRPQPRSTQPAHWIETDLVRKRFWAFAKGALGLTEDEVHEALQVKSVKDYKGTMDMAKLALEAYAIDRGS